MRLMNIGTKDERAKLINLDLVESIVDNGDSLTISFASSVPLGAPDIGKIKCLTSKLTLGEFIQRARTPGEVLAI